MALPAAAPSLDRLSDRELVARCLAAGERYDAAFDAIYARHADRVFGFLLKLTRSREAAEDALQETFVRVHRSLERFDLGRDLSVWLLQIARYVAIDAFRVERKVKRLEAAVSAERPEPARDDPARAAAEQERAAVVNEVLEGLSIDDRALLVLRHYHGLTFQAIGEVADCSARTAQNRVEAAARRFQLALQARRGEGGGA
ncbi:MAG: sigma-70 family RNA polymerase sigma factor [Planctomycetes bacterium]|nr:sigma-70 family RNA polymerase sigma factor [Planctomycetota bacterium]